MKIKSIITNILHAVSVNILRLLISISLTLILPKFLGVQIYSYWQLYLFYLMYIVYSSLGICEGVYLKYGGQDYDKLDKPAIGGQFWALATYQVLLFLFVALAISVFAQDQNKKIILTLALVSAVFDILRYFLQMVLQTTNKIKDYARVAGIERILFFIFVIVALLFKAKDYKVFIIAEILARALSLVYVIVMCKSIVFAKMNSIKSIIAESKKLISEGHKLLVGYLASQLVIGIVRFSIENYWGTVVFGKVSLALSIANMLVTTIGAISIVFFPILKKMKKERLSELYQPARTIITYSVLFVFIFYNIIKVLLNKWLPDYSESIKYLVVILPICVFEIRSFLLTDTYFKAYRRPDIIFKCGVITVGFSLLFSYISVFILHNLDFALACIVILTAIKNILAEYYLKRFINKMEIKQIIYEIILITIFILSNWFIGGWIAMLIYTAIFLLYTLRFRDRIFDSFRKVRNLV